MAAEVAAEEAKGKQGPRRRTVGSALQVLRVLRVLHVLRVLRSL